jgi:putative toxin-antitoxin system antitoxin component (TIGR02293 family)
VILLNKKVSVKNVLGFLGIKSSVSNIVLIELIEKGLQLKHYKKVRKLYQLSDNEMAKIIGISLKKLQAMKPSDRFNTRCSERIMMMGELGVVGIEVLMNEENFRTWLNYPSVDCGGRKPKEFLNNSYGLRELHNILGRIEHGIPH